MLDIVFLFPDGLDPGPPLLYRPLMVPALIPQPLNLLLVYDLSICPLELLESP
jgi:hypothetical protein